MFCWVRVGRGGAGRAGPGLGAPGDVVALVWADAPPTLGVVQSACNAGESVVLYARLSRAERARCGGGPEAGARCSLAGVGAVTTSERESRALARVDTLTPKVRAALLARGSAPRHEAAASDLAAPPPAAPCDVPARLWAALARAHNPSQLEAMVLAAGVGDAGARARVASPLCLIQGPPGTGKTRTVLGVVSVALAAARLRAERGAAGARGAGARPKAKGIAIVPGTTLSSPIRKEAAAADAAERAGRAARAAKAAGRPRAIVCAPSNVAANELVERLCRSGLVDADGAPFTPRVVRVGAA